MSGIVLIRFCGTFFSEMKIFSKPIKFNKIVAQWKK